MTDQLTAYCCPNHVCLEEARAASQEVRDDALHTEVLELRAALEAANDQLELQHADLVTCRVQRDAASAVADLALRLIEIFGGKR